MNGRERLIEAIHHRPTDRPPIDLGATAVTGIHASTLYGLRRALGLEERPITVHEVFQQLGSVEPDVLAALSIDVVGLWNPTNFVGVRNDTYKEWTAPQGIPARIAAGFEYDRVDGEIFAYPNGHRTAAPSFHMPRGGWFFDNIERSAGSIDDEPLTPREDYAESFSVLSDEDARYFERESRRLATETELGVIGNLGAAGFGDVALLPGPSVDHPRGIRRMDEWLMAHKLHPDYIHEVYSMQLEIGLKNLEIYRQAVGDRIQVIFMGGTDFGTQNCEFMPREDFLEFYAPYWKRMNDWVHHNTGWKTFYHTCGSIPNLIGDMADAGADILNPVQCSAHGMEAKGLKARFGDRLTFWGGGVDTQKTLPFGTPEEVLAEVRERISIFSSGGGYILNPIHNVQARTPVDNLLAFFRAAGVEGIG